MCGIAGIISAEADEGDKVYAMLAAMRHRGPDCTGLYSRESVSAGTCRLSINGLKNGNQPLFNEDHSVAVLYNGEIYNSPDLRRYLSSRGHTLQTDSDGEVIGHLYEEMGDKFASALDGMFAIFIHDAGRDRFLLSRDIAGEKPLHYFQRADGAFVFASTVDAIACAYRERLTLNVQSIWDMPTFLWIPEPETIFNEVCAVPRGTTISLVAGQMRSHKVDMEEEDRIDYADEREVCEYTRAVIHDAVRSRLLAEVPIGACLSSGIDSSIVCTLAAKYVANLQTFTVSFSGEERDQYNGLSNEAELAKTYAIRLGVQHHVISASGAAFRSLFNDFVRASDQPFAVASGLGVLAVAREARERGVRVLLGGDGADEAFGGYPWYSRLAPSGGMPYSTPSYHDISFQHYSPDKGAIAQRIREHDAHKQAWAWHYYASEADKQLILNADFFNGRSRSSLRYFAYHNPNTCWRKIEFVRQDREFYLPYEMLRKMDRMTMAQSVEGRLPFVARDVLVHCSKLRFQHMVHRSTQKVCLRKAFSGVVPEEILDRSKHGFNIPIESWLKNEWLPLLQHTFSTDSALYKLAIISDRSQDVALRMLHSKTQSHAQELFAYVALNSWFEQHWIK